MSCSTHQADINDLYYDIVNTVQGCIRKCIPTQKLNRHFIVSWNDEVKHYSELYDLTFNAKKSMYMYFSTSINKHCGCLVIYLGNSILCEFVKEVKYLGVIIHSSMKTTTDVARQTRKFYLQANLLIRNSRLCCFQVKCVLFQAYCTNLYC